MGIQLLIEKGNDELVNPGKHLVSDIQWEQIVVELGLSKRESEVCRMLFYGMNRRQIAASLELKFSTIRRHVENIYSKLQVNNRVSIALRIIQTRDQLDD